MSVTTPAPDVMGDAPTDLSAPSAGTTALEARPDRVAAAAVRVVLRISRFVVGGVFVVAGITKLLQPLAFLHNVYDYKLLGPMAGLLVAAVLPWLEVIVGLLLISGVALPGASALASAFLAVFVGAQGWALYRDLAIDCGCFGFGGENPVGAGSLMRTTILLLMSLAVLVAASRVKARTG